MVAWPDDWELTAGAELFDLMRTCLEPESESDSDDDDEESSSDSDRDNAGEG